MQSPHRHVANVTKKCKTSKLLPEHALNYFGQIDYSKLESY